MTTVDNVEFHWLLFTITMTALMWLPYIINRMHEQGILKALWDPDGHTEARAAWANRMRRAHENAVENLVVFAPLVLLVLLTGRSSDVSMLAVQIYFYARLSHYIVFSLAVPVLRVVSFLAGFAAQIMLVMALLE